MNLEQIGVRIWAVYFGPVHFGWLDEEGHRLMDVRIRRGRISGVAIGL